MFLLSVRANKKERYFRLLPIVKITGYAIFTVETADARDHEQAGQGNTAR